jgi:hypothetical protein
LQTLGVATTQIYKHAFGENHPLANNADGQSKGQNRRVEIMAYNAVLSDFETYKAKKQTFLCNNKRDTTLIGRNGTRIDIPKGAFKTTSDAPITLHLEEYYNRLEMLMGGLTTKAGNNLLETGGMLNLTAEQQGEPLELAKSIRLQMPKFKDLDSENAQKSDYQLFNGEGDPHANQELNWALSSTNTQVTTPTAGKDAFWTRYTTTDKMEQIRRRKDTRKNYIPDGILWDTLPRKQVKKYFKNKVSKQKDSLFAWQIDTIEAGNFQIQLLPAEPALRKYTITELEKLSYTTFSSVLAKYGKIRLDFSVEPSGDVEKITPYISDKTDSLEMVKMITKWFPIRNAKFSPLVKTWVRVDLTNKKSQETIITETKTGDKSRDIILAENQAALNGGFAEYYLFETSTLGWINCDRFQENTDPVNMIVKTDEKAKVRIVFKKLRSIMSAIPMPKGNYTVEKIPNNEPAYIIGLTEKDGKAFIALKEVKASAVPVTDLQFELATPEKLAKLAELLN